MELQGLLDSWERGDVVVSSPRRSRNSSQSSPRNREIKGAVGEKIKLATGVPDCDPPEAVDQGLAVREKLHATLDSNLTEDFAALPRDRKEFEEVQDSELASDFMGSPSDHGGSSEDEKTAATVAQGTAHAKIAEKVEREAVARPMMDEVRATHISVSQGADEIAAHMRAQMRARMSDWDETSERNDGKEALPEGEEKPKEQEGRAEEAVKKRQAEEEAVKRIGEVQAAQRAAEQAKQLKEDEEISRIAQEAAKKAAVAIKRIKEQTAAKKRAEKLAAKKKSEEGEKGTRVPQSLEATATAEKVNVAESTAFNKQVGKEARADTGVAQKKFRAEQQTVGIASVMQWAYISILVAALAFWAYTMRVNG